MLYAGDGGAKATTKREKLLLEYHQTVATMPRYASDALWCLGYLADYSEKFTTVERQQIEGTAKLYFFFVLETGEMQRLFASGKSDESTFDNMRKRIKNISEYVTTVRNCFTEFGKKLGVERLGEDVVVPPSIARVAGSAVDEYRKQNAK